MGFLSSAGGLLAGKMFGADPRSQLENQQHFSKVMMKNKHQWEVEDLRKAGLNPILSATKGSTPMGSSGSGGSVPGGDNDLVTAAQVGKIQAETKLINVRATKEGLTEPIYEEGGDIVKDVVEKVKNWFTGSANSAQDVRAPVLPKLTATAKSNSAKTADAIAKPDSKMNKALRWLLKGKVAPIATTYTPRSADYQKAFAKVKKLVKGKSYKERKKAYDYFNKRWKSKK